MSVLIKIRGGTAAELTTANALLAVRELCYETDTGKWKLGDGSTLWNALPYRAYSKAEVDTLLGNKSNTGHTHAISDVTGLSGALADKADLVGGTLPTSQLPAIAITEFLGEVADETAMLLLSGERGDWCIRTDLGATFVLIDDFPTVLANWRMLEYAGAPVSSVNGQVGVVVLGKGDVGLGNVDNTSDANKPVSTAQATAIATKANTSHTHAATDITEDSTHRFATDTEKENWNTFPVNGGTTGTVTGTRYVSVSAEKANTSTQVGQEWRAPFACQIVELAVHNITAMPADSTMVVTIQKNQADTTMTTTFGVSEAVRTDHTTTANPVTLATGDKVTLKAVKSGTAGAAFNCTLLVKRL